MDPQNERRSGKGEGRRQSGEPPMRPWARADSTRQSLWRAVGTTSP